MDQPSGTSPRLPRPKLAREPVRWSKFVIGLVPSSGLIRQDGTPIIPVGDGSAVSPIDRVSPRPTKPTRKGDRCTGRSETGLMAVLRSF